MRRNSEVIEIQRRRRKIGWEINTSGLLPFDFPKKDLRDVPGTKAHFDNGLTEELRRLHEKALLATIPFGNVGKER